MIRLFTTIYAEQDPKRRSEYRACFERNVACSAIAEICVYCEGGEDLLPETNKLKARAATRRPTYNEYFDWIAELSGDDDISIIANSDIYFDNQLRLFEYWSLPHDRVLALSRWETVGVRPRLFDYGDSQDSWILRGKPRQIYGDFSVGVARCDNRIAAELERAGYRVENPAFSLRSFHMHDANPRLYLEDIHSRRISPPYKYIEPHNLFGPARTLAHNLAHPECKLGYRIDFRQWKRYFPYRAMLKIKRLVSRRSQGAASS